ncbi:uncharacterized protein LOC124308067 isoform X1 [Neodiprion virginianus]|uniref:uncharacterized protein LOC124308067 isoform X1 n=2 Tax=Neodiprion virginianus TaxID=2961670 RepID=UPI001EE779F1|nr:uncharacterized protein LOC124308067 isoform X1 [Neodiprion virginianus]
MEKVFQLMMPVLTSPSTTITPSCPNEIRSPSLDFFPSNAPSFRQRKRLFEPIIKSIEKLFELDIEEVDEIGEANRDATNGQIDREGSLIYVSPAIRRRELFINSDSPTASYETDSSMLEGLKNLKSCARNQRTIHSSPKLVNSHFEDSGFMNCSIEMVPWVQRSISDLDCSQKTLTGEQDSENNPDSDDGVSFDSYLQGGEDHSWSFGVKEIEMQPPKNGNVGIKPCAKNLDNRISDKLSNDKLEAERNALDPNRGVEKCSGHNQSLTNIEVECEDDATAKKSTNTRSRNETLSGFVHKCSLICANHSSFPSKENCLIFDGLSSAGKRKQVRKRPTGSDKGRHDKMQGENSTISECLEASTLSVQAEDYHLIHKLESISLQDITNVKSSKTEKKIPKLIVFE